MELAQAAVLHDPAGAVAHDRAQQFGRLDGAGQHGRVQPTRTGQLIAGAQPGGQGSDLAPAQIGQARAPAGAAHDALDVAARLAVAYQHDPGGPGHRGEHPPHPAGHAERAAERGGVFAVLVRVAHARLPTKCSSWRSVRHSTTSSQCAAYSPTMESPDPQ